MLKKIRAQKLKGIERCPDGHLYNTDTYGEFCEVCGKRLDPLHPDELTSEEREELTHVDEKDWVCGWLVCIRGPNKGSSYKIRMGRNFIGSDSKYIQITGDRQIDKNHAIITYDESNHTTILQPGASREIIYVQDDAIFKPKELSPFDKIELGKSVFKYVPLCGDKFDWRLKTEPERDSD